MHTCDPDEFRSALAPLRDPQVFATAQVVEPGTLGWVTGGAVIDMASDGLYLHAIGACDGSCAHPPPS